jgi:hexosaminidase
MNPINSIVALLVSFWAATSLASSTSALAIIPQPKKIQTFEGAFGLTPATGIYADANSSETAGFLATRLRKSTGYRFEIDSGQHSDAAVNGGLLLTTNRADAALGAEGYELVVGTNCVIIRACSQAGLFYGVQTLLQLLPPNIFSSQVVAATDWRIPCVKITDQPRFQWRGLMLDVSRHFYTKQEVETLLDAMALHKVNTFHWHLADDQGWRIDIRKYPKLTQVGAWRDGIGFGLAATNSTNYGPDGRYGGFYTQDDIREVVAYARNLHITIVPEIEMPGHASAALLAYPQLLCPNVKLSAMPNSGGVFHGIYCAGNDAAFTFIEDVLSEVAALFPGPFIHIGGDECPKDNWKQCELCQARIKTEKLKNEEELQSYFIRRIEKSVNAHGKTLLGWSEILQGGLAQNAAVMDWIGGGREAASTGHDVVMTPNKYCYFDHYQSTNHLLEPHAIGGYLPLANVYAFEPIPAKLAPEFQKHILGAQANVWTEYIPNLKHAEYMIFPRLAALAEVNWSGQAARNFEDFLRRCKIQGQRFDWLGINYRRERSN